MILCFQEKSEKAKLSRSKNIYEHKMGRGGYVYVKDQMVRLHIMFVLQIDQRRLSWFNFTCVCTDVYQIKNKEIEADEEPPRGVLWVKGRQKDGESPDDEISSLADKLVNLTANSIIMLIYQQH